MQARSRRYADLRRDDADVVRALPTRDISRLTEEGEDAAEAEAAPLPQGLRATGPAPSPRSSPNSFVAPPGGAEARDAVLEKLGAMPIFRPMFEVAHIRELAQRATERSLTAAAASSSSAASTEAMEVSNRSDVMRRQPPVSAAPTATAAGTTPGLAGGDLPRDDPAYPAVDRWAVERGFLDFVYEKRFEYHFVASRIDPENVQFPSPLPVWPDYVDKIITEPYGARKECCNGRYCVGTELYHPKGSFAFPV